MLHKLLKRASSANATKESSINNLLHSFQVSLKAARQSRKAAGFGRRHQLLKPQNEDSSICKAIMDALKAHESEANESSFVHALLMIGSEGQLESSRSLFHVAIKRYPLSADLYSAMIYALARSSHSSAFEEAEELFRRALNQPGLHPTRQLYESLIEAYSGKAERVRLNLPDSSNCTMSVPLRIYRKMLASGHEPRVCVLTSLLKLAGRLEDSGAIEFIRREQERFGVPVDDQFRESLLFALLQCGLVDEAETLFSEYLPSTVHKERLLNVMIHGYCRLDALTPARHLLLQQSALNGLKPGPGIACLLVECASRLGQLREARSWLEEGVLIAVARDGEDDELVWRAGGSLLRAYLRSGDSENFYQLLDHLRKHSDNMTPPVWALLLTALESLPNPLRLHREIGDLLEVQSLDPPAQDALFKMLFMAGASEQLVRRLMSNWQLDQSLQLWILGKLGDWSAAVEMIQKMNNITSADWSSLMMAAGEDVSRVEAVLQRMTSGKVWMGPEVRILAIKAYLNAGRPDELRSHFQALKSSRLPAKMFAQALALQVKSVMGLQGDRDAAFQLLCSHEHSWDSDCLQMFLAMSRQGGQAPRELLRCLKESEVVGRLRRMGRALTGACNEVIAAGVLAGDSDVVVGVLGWMRENSRFGDEQTLRLLLSGSLEGGLRMAEEVVGAYQTAGRLPSLKLIITLVRAQLALSSTPGDPLNTKAEALSEWAVSKGLSLSDSFRELLLVWREYFVKHARLDRVQHLDEILKTIR